MTASVTHAKVSALTDSGDTSIVRPSDWNAEHVIAGLGGNAAVVRGSGAGNTTTTSEAMVDLTGASITMTTGANRVKLGFIGSAFHSAANGSIVAGISVDGVDQDTQFLAVDTTATVERNMSFTHMTDVLTAGSHTFKVRWAGNTGTKTMRNSTSALRWMFWADEPGAGGGGAGGGGGGGTLLARVSATNVVTLNPDPSAETLTPGMTVDLTVGASTAVTVHASLYFESAGGQTRFSLKDNGTRFWPDAAIIPSGGVVPPIFGAEGSRYLLDVAVPHTLTPGAHTITLNGSAVGSTAAKSYAHRVLEVHGTSAGAGGGLIAATQWLPGTQQNINSTNTTSLDDVDATNAAITFIVPPSGAVVVRAEACFAKGAASFWCEIGLKEGSTVIQKARIGELNAGGNLQQFSWRITGLTPGTSKTYKLGFAQGGSGSTATCHVSATDFPLRMEVAEGGIGIGSVGTGEGTWTAPTLLNSWVNYGAPYNTAGFRKDGQGFVHLKGLIKSGTVTGGTDLFVLPVGYRPAATYLFGTLSNDLAARVDVTSNGIVEIAAGGNAGYLSLEGITFLAEG